ncbi:hypothetical protein ACFCV9_10775 [Streptomyces sp. NPDC056367]
MNGPRKDRLATSWSNAELASFGGRPHAVWPNGQAYQLQHSTCPGWKR